jgi:hypothetical protein
LACIGVLSTPDDTVLNRMLFAAYSSANALLAAGIGDFDKQRPFACEFFSRQVRQQVDFPNDFLRSFAPRNLLGRPEGRGFKSRPGNHS